MSNLKNQPQCSAHSKRTGLICKQPCMRGKRVCRFHGGKSTGPKTKQGREHIRQANLRHGRYSKITGEHKAAIRRAKSEKELFQTQERVLDKHLQRLKAHGPYLKAFHEVSTKEEFGLLSMFLFGGFNQMVGRNKLLRERLQELCSILSDTDATLIFDALTSKLEQYLCEKLNVPRNIWKRLSPDQRQEEFIAQLMHTLWEISAEAGEAISAPPLKHESIQEQKLNISPIDILKVEWARRGRALILPEVGTARP